MALLEEQALRTLFGTAETQAGQLGRLLELMALPNVSLGVIPLMTAGIEVTQPNEIQLYARMFEILKASAVYGADARRLIINTLNDLK